VYGWQSKRKEAPGHHRLTREIVAARSKAEAVRCAGYRRASQMVNLAETGNAHEIRTALSRPGAVFWASLDDPRRIFRSFSDLVDDGVAAP
jgi:hypothetical protein